MNKRKLEELEELKEDIQNKYEVNLIIIQLLSF